MPSSLRPVPCGCGGGADAGEVAEVATVALPADRLIAREKGDALAQRDPRHHGAKKHIGTTLDSLFEELGEKEEVNLLTQKKLLAARVQQAMTRKKMTQTDLAQAMRTSRTVVHRLLDPKDTGVTLATLWKASKALGVSLVEVC